jgi:hypothetical protein
LKNILADYEMMIRIDVIQMVKPTMRTDIRDRRQQILRASEKELKKQFGAFVKTEAVSKEE